MFHGHRHKMFPTTEYPAVSDLIVYYVTRVVQVPIFVDTDLQWFRTPVFAKWVQENNLPGYYFDIMKGSLQTTYGCSVPEGVVIELPRQEEQKIERWLSSWKNETFPRKYVMSLGQFRDSLPN